MNTLMNIDPWGFLDDLLDTGSRTLRTMRARAAGKFPPVNVYLDDTAVGSREGCNAECARNLR